MRWGREGEQNVGMGGRVGPESSSFLFPSSLDPGAMRKFENLSCAEAGDAEGGWGGGDNAERQRSTNQHFRPLHKSSLSVHIFMQKQIMTDSSHTT